MFVCLLVYMIEFVQLCYMFECVRMLLCSYVCVLVCACVYACERARCIIIISQSTSFLQNC
jgi:hypothetical protein